MEATTNNLVFKERQPPPKIVLGFIIVTPTMEVLMKFRFREMRCGLYELVVSRWPPFKNCQISQRSETSQTVQRDKSRDIHTSPDQIHHPTNSRLRQNFGISWAARSPGISKFQKLRSIGERYIFQFERICQQFVKCLEMS